VRTMQETWVRVRRAVEIPFDPLDEGTNTGNVVTSVLNLSIVGLVLYLIFSLIDRGFNSVSSLIVVVMIALLYGFHRAVRRGRTELISWLFIGVSWSAATGAFFLSENPLRVAGLMAACIFIVVLVGILLKLGKLTPAEWEVMKTHTVIGAKILRGSTSPSCTWERKLPELITSGGMGKAKWVRPVTKSPLQGA
jgi:hypothetical protein